MSTVTRELLYDKEKGNVIQIRCEDCNRRTNHEILCTVDDAGSEEVDGDFCLD